MTDTPTAEAALDRLRRVARDLGRAHGAGDPEARARVASVAPRRGAATLKHADFLHVVAREEGFASWPALKLAVETRGLDAAQKLQRLKTAIHHGQTDVVDRLLGDTPELARADLAVQIALYDLPGVEAALAADPGAATRPLGRFPPLAWLCQSRMIHHWPDRAGAMIGIAELLVRGGADLDLGPVAEPGSAHRLSPLYFALGHADNLELARWLLERGAAPDDNESLYHATELGHREGLRLLLQHGASPAGTNALARALDFDDAEAVRMLLEAGADPDEGAGSDRPERIPALHQAARRHVSAEIVDMLLAARADPRVTWLGRDLYGWAAVYGHEGLVRRLEALGAARPLDEVEGLLAAASKGQVPEGRYLDMARVPAPWHTLVREILHLPGKLDHVKALIEIGFPWDTPDAEGLTPVQAAGWEGLPQVLAYFLALKPDLGHVNGYGGTLLSSILHGSENCPARAERDHVACARLALEEGVALPRRMPDFAARPEMAAFLADWAEAHPGQVVAHGVV